VDEPAQPQQGAARFAPARLVLQIALQKTKDLPDVPLIVDVT
jgi:hypothetical protein